MDEYPILLARALVLRTHAPILDEMRELSRCHAGSIRERYIDCAPNPSEVLFATSVGRIAV